MRTRLVISLTFVLVADTRTLSRKWTLWTLNLNIENRKRKSIMKHSCFQTISLLGWEINIYGNEDRFHYRNTISHLLQLIQYREWKVKIGTRVLVRRVSLDPLHQLVWYGRYVQPSRGLREDGLACGKVHMRAREPVEIESFVSGSSLPPCTYAISIATSCSAHAMRTL